MNKGALGILLEVSVLDPFLAIENFSTDWIPRILVSPGINNFQISALVCRVLSSWLDDPMIRQKAELQLVMEVHLNRLFNYFSISANLLPTTRSWILQPNGLKDEECT